MRAINRTYVPIEAMLDELARCGLEHAVACPGSRNAPILLSLAAEERIRTWSVLDERSAGFLALGMAKTSGKPVLLTCTSGTAAANFLPAVVEARESRVPLIVLTADRPPELREVGAGQSIDQMKLYGSAAKWFVEVGNLEPGRESAVHHRALACRAWATAAGGRPGVVHLNLPLREPLAPVEEELDGEVWEGRADGSPWVKVDEAPPSMGPEDVERLARDLAGVSRGAIVCGPTSEHLAEEATALAAALGWPLLAEPTSGVRCGPARPQPRRRSLRRAAAAPGDGPRRIGPTWCCASATHRPRSRCGPGSATCSQIVVDPHAVWHEPTRAANRVIVSGAAPLCRALTAALGDGAQADSTWLASWRSADAAVAPALAAQPDPFEPKIYAALAELLPDDAPVWVSSSMPIRDVETFFPSTEKRLRFLSNRGANGIDGIISSALGAAAATGGHAYLLTGELALLHDIGALLAAQRLGLELTIVCVNNGGGGIFDFLPVAEHADPAAYERLVATPSGVDLGRLAAGIGIRHMVAETTDELRAAVAKPGLVEVRTDRARNVEQHRALLARLIEELDRQAG